MKFSIQKILFLGCVSMAVGIPQGCWAFPEMVRHGYLSCLNCHYSPNGGGILNAFGREASKILLSTYSKEHEELPAYGIIPLPDWFNLATDIRVLQAHRQTTTSIQGRLVLMQSDLELAVRHEGIAIVGTLGRESESVSRGVDASIMSRRHYFLYHPHFEPRLMVRGGRFNFAYGLHIPDHAVVIKQGLGWDHGTEEYNLELSWSETNQDFFLTWISGALRTEKAVAFRYRRYLLSSSRIGASVFLGEQPGGHRLVFGPYATLGISKKLFWLNELDFQRRIIDVPQSLAFGAGFFSRVGCEFTQGLLGLATFEYSRWDFNSRKDRLSFWLGAQFFPRPHWEVVANWQKTKDLAVSNQFEDLFWVVAHFYL